MDFYGHSFGFILRVDIEHVEAQRYLQDYRLERVGVTNLLDLLREIGTPGAFAVLGITAELLPNMVQEIADEHEIFGHSMFHEPALAGRPLDEQRHEMVRMMAAIEQACGVRCRGIAVPHHGFADENTLRAAAEAGLQYVQAGIRAEDSVLPRWHAIEGTDLKVLVPGDQGRGASDYSARRKTWARIHEEAFSIEGATAKWKGNIDWAKANGKIASLVVHPWMTMLNPGEFYVIKEVMTYARDQGAWIGTYDKLADLSLAQYGS